MKAMIAAVAACLFDPELNARTQIPSECIVNKVQKATDWRGQTQTRTHAFYCYGSAA